MLTLHCSAIYHGKPMPYLPVFIYPWLYHLSDVHPSSNYILVITLLVLSYRNWYVPFSNHSVFTDVSFSGSQTSAVDEENLHKHLIIQMNDWSSFLHFGNLSKEWNCTTPKMTIVVYMPLFRMWPGRYLQSIQFL